MQAMNQALERVMDETEKSIHIPTLLNEVEPRAVLFEALRPYGFVDSQIDDVFHSLKGESGRRFANKEWQVLKDRDALFIRPNNGEVIPEIRVHQLPVKVTLTDASCLQINCFSFTPDYQIPHTSDVATLDAALVELPLTIRPWKQGDKFAPFGMKGKKKLVSDLLTDLKLSLYEKEAQLVVTDACDRILWVVGRRSDERVRVTEDTKDIMELRINK